MNSSPYTNVVIKNELDELTDAYTPMSNNSNASNTLRQQQQQQQQANTSTSSFIVTNNNNNNNNSHSNYSLATTTNNTTDHNSISQAHIMPPSTNRANQHSKQSTADQGGNNKRNHQMSKSNTYGGGGGGRATNGTNSNGSSGNVSAESKKTKGRVKIKMEFIDNKLRRYTTFSKRKTGIMKKAYELSTLTGTQVMLLVASETGHVYTFATRKLQPMITSETGKALIQTCLNSPDAGLAGGPEVVTTNSHLSMSSAVVAAPPPPPCSSSASTATSMTNGGGGGGLAISVIESSPELSRAMLSNSNGSMSSCPTPTNTDQRMSVTGYEETDLSYSISAGDCSPLNDKHLYHASPTPSSTSSLSSVSSSAATPPIMHSAIAADPNSLHQHQSLGPMGNANGLYESGAGFLSGDRATSMDASTAYSSQYLVPIVSTAASVITSHNQQQLGQQQQQQHHGQQQMFTTLNSASMGHQNFGQHPPQPQPIATSSSASFFNTFATNSPPPLTPNGLLSGLHTFLFPDSALGLDSFIEPNDVSCMSNGVSFLSPSSATPVAGVPHHTGAPSLSGTSPSSTNIRLPPFCTI